MLQCLNILQQVKIFYRELKPEGYRFDDYTILLLHGAAFTSRTWVDIKTMHLIAAMGFRVVALDLPGKLVNWIALGT